MHPTNRKTVEYELNFFLNVVHYFWSDLHIYETIVTAKGGWTVNRLCNDIE
jgi:hypothetical protein